MKTAGFDARRVEEALFKCLMVCSTAIVVGTLAAILGIVAVRGARHVSLEMLTRPPESGYFLGGGGGIANAILGSLFLAVGATVLSLAVGLPVVLYVNVLIMRRTFTARAVRFTMDLLWGVPSIVYGAFGFVLMMALGLKASLGAAIVTVALLELPIMVRAMDEVVKAVPPAIGEASFSLGATRVETAFRVVARQALPGLATAVLMAFGRGIGDTASVLFTAGFTDAMPASLGRQAATLPIAIWQGLSSPLAEVQGRAYAAALVLTFIVLAASVTAHLLAGFWSRNTVK